ncbi:MAG TPA: DUF1987 domain-containing protein [Bacteroidales bacterium]|nr:DUF1987 domain-containing protein [Bacteroidales bacterium]
MTSSELTMKELQSLILENTPKTPQIDLNKLTGDLILSGRSIPENAAKLYEPVLTWVNEYVNDPRPATNLRINLEYFNSASSIWLAKILKTLTRIDKEDYVLIIHLYIHIDDFEEMEEFDDIKDVFFPIGDIFHGSTVSIGLKLYGIDDNGITVKNTSVFF